MVKPWIFRFFKLLLALITVVFIYFLVEVVYEQCSQCDLPWRLDSDYTHYLTIMTNEYPSTPGSDIYDTVDGLRIYKERSTDYEWYGLENLFKKELVFETKDKRYIKEILLAIQKWMSVGDWEDAIMSTEEASEGCGRGHLKERGESDWFYVVMFDNTFKRAGYFLALPCKTQDKEYMNILVPDTSGFGPISYYNETLIPIFSKIPRAASKK